MRVIAGAAAFLCVVSLASPLAAQSIRLEGRWTLNRERTQLPNMPPMTLEIRQTAGTVDYLKTVKDPQNEWVTHMVLPADGRETTWTDWNRTKLKCSGIVRDGTFVLAYESRQQRSSKWVILSIEEVHTVSEDGKTLSIAHTEAWEGKRGKLPNPLVFDRSAGPSTGARRRNEVHRRCADVEPARGLRVRRPAHPDHQTPGPRVNVSPGRPVQRTAPIRVNRIYVIGHG